MQINLPKIPEGQAGPWRIRHFEVTEEAEKLNMLRAVVSSSSRGRWVRAGWYVGLYRAGGMFGEEMIMSNTFDELRDLLPWRQAATGSVLIAGLGLGCAVQIALEKKEVRQITVIEQSPEVIHLVAGSYNDPRVQIIQADIFTWQWPKEVRYDAAWFDIWDHISPDNLPDMAILHRRFARVAKWKGSWCKEQCKHR